MRGRGKRAAGSGGAGWFEDLPDLDFSFDFPDDWGFDFPDDWWFDVPQETPPEAAGSAAGARKRAEGHPKPGESPEGP